MKIEELINKGYIVYFNGVAIFTGFALAFQIKCGFIVEVLSLA